MKREPIKPAEARVLVVADNPVGEFSEKIGRILNGEEIRQADSHI